MAEYTPDPKTAVVFALHPSQIAASSPEALGVLMKAQYYSQLGKATYIRWETKVAE